MKYQIYGKVIATDDSGTRVLAEGSSIHEAESPTALRVRWEADMHALFPDGPHSTVELFCRVTGPLGPPPPAPETEAGANAYDRPAGFPRDQDKLREVDDALDVILAPANWRTRAAVAWSWLWLWGWL